MVFQQLCNVANIKSKDRLKLSQMQLHNSHIIRLFVNIVLYPYTFSFNSKAKYIYVEHFTTYARVMYVFTFKYLSSLG